MKELIVELNNEAKEAENSLSSIPRRGFLKGMAATAGVMAAGPAFSATSPSPEIVPKYRTAYGYSEYFSKYYQNGTELPERVLAIHKQLNSERLVEKMQGVRFHQDPMAWVAKLHNTEHIKGIQSTVVESDYGATETMGDIAELAVGCALGAVDEVMSGRARNAFCNLRPPGHHAINGGYSSGYCCYANVAIAAKYARQQYGIERVLIIDWDYHHGNGTLDKMCADKGVYFFETAGYLGSADQCNSSMDHAHTFTPEGQGGNAEFERVFKQKLLPAAKIFKPQLVLISCGFDLKKNDGLGSFNVTATGISKLTKMAMEIADATANGRVVSLLEGGYCDSDRSNYSDYSAKETFHGLSAMAASHVRTLLSNQNQPEASYYLPSSFSNLGEDFSKHKPLIRSQGKNLVIGGPENYVKSVIISDFKGRQQAFFSASNVSEGSVLMHNLKSGNYLASIKLFDGSTQALKVKID